MQINRILARQYGLILRAQALGCGMTDRHIDVKLASGKWARVGYMVYRDATHEVTDRQLALAAVFVAGEGALLSEDSATAFWDVPGWSLLPCHITVPYERHPTVHGAVIHRSRRLGRLDRTTLGRVPITTPARTLIDIADRPTALVEDAVDELLCRGSVSLGHLVRRARSLSGHGFDGPRQLLSILEAWVQDEERSTKRELRVVRDIVAAGLPAPVRQHSVRSPSGRLIAITDLAYPPALVAVEFQSFRWHATRRAWERDQQRTADLVAMGWTVYPATQDSLRNRCRHLCTWLAQRVPQARAA